VYEVASPPGFTLPVTVALVGPVTVTDTMAPDGSEAARAGDANKNAATDAAISPRLAIDLAATAKARFCLSPIEPSLGGPGD
jgi:hypothetical protein